MNLATIVGAHRGETPALLTDAGEIDYATLRGQVSAVRELLVGRGFGPGDRLAIVDANTPRFVATHLAALAAGLVSVPLDPASPAAELERAIQRVGPTAVVGAKARDAVAVMANERTISVLDDEIEAAMASSSPAESVEAVSRSADDVAVLLFTSGTAGAPRIAMLTHGNLLANLDQLQRHPGRSASSDDRVYGAVPFSHVFGLSSVLHLTLFAGGSVHLVDRFHPAEALAAVRDLALTVVVGPPPMWTALASVDGAGPADTASVRLAVSGASALPAAVHADVRRRFGVDLSEGYGLTEASPAVSMSAGTAAPPGSVGEPLPGVEVRLVDAEGADVLVGDPGEVWVRGPNVFAGYLDDVDATEAVLDADGWLHTGDVAVVDDDGYLTLVDRIKDLIIVSGFNVYPAEVEQALRRHPEVVDAAVVGTPNERTGESVQARVVLRPGSALGPADLRVHCAGQLARYKCPTVIEVVPELPVRADGKLVRRALR